jgi:phage gp36-like protein
VAYSALADLQKELDATKLTQLADDNGDGVADAGVIDEAIAAADDEINGYLATRITVPVSPVPGIIKRLSARLAIYQLYKRRDVLPEVWRDVRSEAIRFLRDFADGNVDLGISPAPAETELVLPKSTTVESNRDFTRGKASDGSSGTLDNF